MNRDQSKKMNVLVVDDSPTVRAVIKSRLKEGGYGVFVAENGAEALRVIVQNHGSIDLVTLDVEMPVMDGFRTCEELNKEKYRSVFSSKKSGKLPVLFVTSKDSLEDRKKGFELGASDFIGKDFLENEILMRVNKILRPAQRMKGLSALVVEDSSMYRVVVVDALMREGVTVDEAENGKEAYDMIAGNLNKYDMLVTDLNMPEMNGIELINAVRVELGLSKLPIVILSSISDKVTQLDLFKCGANDYLTKPFIKEELLARLRVHLEQELLNRELKGTLLEMKKLNSELKESREIVEKQSNQRKELLHVLCHDLANPLSSVISALELMEVSPASEEIKEAAEDVAYKGLDIINLVRKMRALEEGKMEFRLIPVNLKEFLNQSCLMLKKKFEDKKIEVEVDVDDSILVQAEPISFLNSVLNNLFTNAIKFSYEGSTVTAKAALDGAGCVVLTISDSGIGMPEMLLNDIFDINKTTSRPGTKGEQGTGFGMPLVKKFMNAYDGEIKAFSRCLKKYPDNHGTDIELRLKSGKD